MASVNPDLSNKSPDEIVQVEFSLRDDGIESKDPGSILSWHRGQGHRRTVVRRGNKHAREVGCYHATSSTYLPARVTTLDG
ncbi:hypothetical protein ACRE_001400 [Hapsidospora chrysogenum ATCC 11550]|uniref:Uncharacterized protein n=1 Tax=Hapsidospora chrysogenum (strain ATCC 11550 / CBS 779.69 / DSM 880 / IAM 14645 / JCM 23072 / IMI 49137) TaxID=857340 RepID=A0A086TI56_HAPC1|nr:hypothetical protein ACRE_001400 [Hapsidospora chrysogenum ATCC 11550]